jgi:hypothetical protein
MWALVTLREGGLGGSGYAFFFAFWGFFPTEAFFAAHCHVHLAATPKM